jgi:AraC-like DNA-binding protein
MPEVGFVVGERLSVDCLGALGGAMAGAGNLAEALRLFCRLVPRHVEDNRLWVEEGGRGEVWLFNEVVDRIEGDSDIADHAGMMTLVNVIRLAAGPDWYPERMTLQAAPTEAWRQVPALEACRIEFGCDATGVAFPARLLLEPVGVPARQRECPSKVSELLAGDESLPDKIAELLRSIVGVGGVLPSVHLAAEIAGTSPRTLHRRLREQGRTYQEILDEVRYERATHLLSHSDATIKELATELGFSGANNFIRYFRRIAGMTPSKFRDEMGKRPDPEGGTP